MALGALSPFQFALVLLVLCRLQKLQKDIETAERTEDHHLQVLKELETLLQARRAELEKLRSQVGQQTPRKPVHAAWKPIIKSNTCLIVEKTGKYIIKYKAQMRLYILVLKNRVQPKFESQLSTIYY